MIIRIWREGFAAIIFTYSLVHFNNFATLTGIYRLYKIWEIAIRLKPRNMNKLQQKRSPFMVSQYNWLSFDSKI